VLYAAVHASVCSVGLNMLAACVTCYTAADELQATWISLAVRWC
jgi:hypothetical protein